MIKQSDLHRWREAKNLAITSLNIDTEVAIAMQEMYIELKLLRQDNLKLLNTDTLIDKLVEYVRDSRDNHYISPDLEERIEDIEHWISTHKLDLEI